MQIINEFATKDQSLKYYVAKISNGEYKIGYRDVMDDDVDHFNDDVHVSYEDALNDVAYRIGEDVAGGDAFSELYDPVLNTLRQYKWEQVEADLLHEIELGFTGRYAILNTKNGYAWTFYDNLEDDDFKDGYESKKAVMEAVLEDAFDTLTREEDRMAVKDALKSLPV